MSDEEDVPEDPPEDGPDAMEMHPPEALLDELEELIDEESLFGDGCGRHDILDGIDEEDLFGDGLLPGGLDLEEEALFGDVDDDEVAFDDAGAVPSVETPAAPPPPELEPVVGEWGHTSNRA